VGGPAPVSSTIRNRDEDAGDEYRVQVFGIPGVQVHNGLSQCWVVSSDKKKKSSHGGHGGHGVILVKHDLKPASSN
jgi:hypothetical protein